MVSGTDERAIQMIITRIRRRLMTKSVKGFLMLEK